MRSLIPILCLALPGALVADDGVAFLQGAKYNLDLRYRYETVSQDGFAEDATASTLRARFGVTTAEWRHLSAMLEYESVVVVGMDEYNDTANGKVAYPVIADPEDHEVNQAFLQWQSGDTRVRWGRQRFTLDNHRFFGTVGFRQNEQTFDGATLAARFGDARVTVATLGNANRVFGANHPVAARADTDLEAELVNVRLPVGAGDFVVYMHRIGLPDAPLASHRNLGARYAAEYDDFWDGKLRVTLEFAQQDAYDGGAASIDHDYRLMELGWGGDRWGFRFGQELLGGNGLSAFQTPLATLHAFNGWADRFLVTPAAGLEDRYLTVDSKLGGVKLIATWHEYGADFGGADYGSEFDLGLSLAYDARTTLKLEYADYQADGFAVDTRILWLTVDYRF